MTRMAKSSDFPDFAVEDFCFGTGSGVDIDIESFGGVRKASNDIRTMNTLWSFCGEVLFGEAASGGDATG